MVDISTQKHPKALWYIIAIYIWEYFSFYGMRTLLILYLIDFLKLGDTKSYAIAGAYVTLVYLSPIVGGVAADKILGYKKAVIYGASLMSIGHLILGFGGDSMLFYGMAFIVCGYGFFKSNVSCLLGQQYTADDPKKDSAFTLLYLGGNLGGIIAPALCGLAAYYYGWHYGFGIAGIGMILGLIIFISGSKHIPDVIPENSTSKTLQSSIIILSILVVLFASYFSLSLLWDGYLLAVVTAITVVYFIAILFKVDSSTRKSLLILVPFFIFGIVFWMFDEQLYTSVEVFIHRNVDTYLLGIDIPASMFTSMNSLSILFGGLVVAWIWKRVKSLDNDFGRMIKFSFGFIFQLLCFILFFMAAKNASVDGTTSALIVIIALACLGVSELFIDPIALSEITSIKDKKHTGFLAATYMLFTGSIAGFIGAKVADFASLGNSSSKTLDLISQAELFQGLFMHIIFVIFVTVLLWFVVAFFIKKLK
ncbi:MULTISPECIES: peptide MFS transporter [unclassified Francisella]|uniref:peptide MFS transporter n=1 Tax=unclassified Francisella TaxID=2610885 RepID=UPI002E359E56|nr:MULTISPECIES: oligopeptide:H+ symporter [unclassified Francisella]MED7819235.1 oligopeptide:H+ symporter [Francisella sp. 19S2-4]MED7830024.1 oligopeptide:H+ symporter [Francisella sp. 19S2-10]